MSGDPVRVLLVEDDADQARLVRRALERQEPPFKVTVVGDGVACLETVAREPYSVVLLDYSLPRLNGLEVLKTLRDRGFSVPVIMVTGQGDERVAVEAIKARASDYIIKIGGYLTTLPPMIYKALKQHELALENARLFETARSLSRDLTWERDRLEAILRGIGEAVIVTDPADRIILLNPVAEEWLGVQEGVVAGQRFLFCLPDLQFADAWSRWLADNPDFSNQQLQIAYPTARVISATRSRVLDEAGAVLGQVTVLRDITRERELDRMKTAFISNVSHELRAPMASIKGFTSTILRDKQMSADTREHFLEIIHKESERLITLIEELLDISCMESGQVRVARHRISLIEAVERSVAVMTPLFQDKGVKLVSSLDGNECEIVGDLDRACQLIQNLLGNALKFTSASGNVEVNLRQDDAAVSLVVEDTGIGIAPEHLPHIFERFFQVPGGGRGGTGLGLTIVKELVERQGGRIDVRSEPGKGSRFEVMFPRHKPLESEEAHEDSGR